MPDNNKKFDNGQTLERQLPLADSIFQPKIGASDSSHKHKNGYFRKSSNDNSGSVLDADGNDFFGFIQANILSALKNQEMATIKIGWFLFNCFGFTITAYSGTMAYIEGDAFKGWVLFTFGLAFLVIECLRRYEGYRSRKIDNDERLYGIKKNHKKDEANQS